MAEPHRPVGGLRRVRLIPMADLKEVTFSGEGPELLLLRRGASPLDPLLGEGQSHYRERWSLHYGIPSVEHTLSLGLARLGEGALARETLAELLTDGVVALVETMAGECRLVGWSNSLKGEAALRLEELSEESGALRREYSPMRLILSSRDGSSAPQLKNIETCIAYEET
uniref:hypothetical protein n=1 Tax=Alistipes sp. TaxID=1872444 RepID=UPI004055FE66